MMKKHMVPLTPKGETTVHRGKGSQMAAMPDRGQIKQLARGQGSINDFSKASPMPSKTPGPAAPFGTTDLL